MKQRTLLALAAILTAIVLVGVAMVIPGLSRSSTPAQPTAAPAQATIITNTQPQNPTGATTYAVSADQAGTLALNGVPGATLTGTPALVTYQGVVAYEVPLTTGMAYIDATSGQLLAAPADAGTTAGYGADQGAGGDEHEGEHDDDDDDD